MDNTIELKNDKHKESVKVDKESKNPERIDLQSEVKKPKVQKMNEFLSELKTQVETIENSRDMWRKRNIHFYKRRQGLRAKKNSPWRGCSNDTMMTEDKVIKKMNPAYFNMIWANKRIADFIPDPETPRTDQTDDQAEINGFVFDHIVRNKIEDAKRKTLLLIDRMHQDGKVFMKVTYDYRVEKREYVLNLETLEEDEKLGLANLPGQDTVEGSAIFISYILALLSNRGIELDMEKESIREQLRQAYLDYDAGAMECSFNYDVIAPHAPKWTVVKARDLIVHGSFNNIQDATMITHKMKWTPNDLRKAIQDGTIKKSTGEAILNLNSNSSNTDTIQSEFDEANTQATGDRNKDNEQDLINIWETCLYACPDRSGVLKKCVVTYCPEYLEDNIKFVTLPYLDNFFPYAEFVEEESDEGFLSSRSIPHKINYFSSGIDKKHNQRNDSVEIANNPMMKYVEGQVQTGKINFKPGQGIACKRALTDLDVMSLNPGNTGELLREQQILQFQVEDYIAVPDFTLSDPNAPGSQARTASEVMLKSQDRKSVFRVDLELFVERLKFLLKLTWSRQLQFGKSNIVLNVKQEEETGTKEIVWSRSIGQLKMHIVPTGSFENTNIQEKRQNAQTMMQLSESPVFGPMIKSFNVLQDLISSMDKSKLTRWTYNRSEWEQQMTDMKADAERKAKEEKITEIRIKEAEDAAKKDLEISKIKEKGKVDLALKLADNKMNKKEEKEANDKTD